MHDVQGLRGGHRRRPPSQEHGEGGGKARCSLHNRAPLLHNHIAGMQEIVPHLHCHLKRAHKLVCAGHL